MRSDLRYAVRGLRRAPALAATAVLMLALGVGATTAIFSVFDKVMLQAMPVARPGELVGLRASEVWEGSSHTHGGGLDAYFSYPMYQDLSARRDVFAGLLCSSPVDVGISGGISGREAPALTDAELVSGNTFQVLGLQPALGRLLLPSDTRVDGSGAVAVLSFQYWQSHFGASPKILSATLRVNGQPFTVVGVAPPQFHGVVGGDDPQLYLPITMQTTAMPDRDDYLPRHDTRWLTVTGRLAPGMTRARAETALAPMWHGLRVAEFQRSKNHSERFRKAFVDASPLRLVSEARGFSVERGLLQQPLTLLLGLGGLVLLMVCANVASLLLVRAAARSREMAVRYALGARQGRIFAQLLAEGSLLGGTGAMAGIALALLLTRGLLQMLFTSPEDPLPYAAGLNGRTLLFSVLVAGATTVVFSVVPMLEFWRPDVSRALKALPSTQSSGPARLRRALVTAQIAVSVVLLVAAGFFVRTLGNLRDANAGFTTSHVLAVQVDPELSGYAQEQIQSLYQTLLQQLEGLPGVQAAGATNAPLLRGSSGGGNITVVGYKAAPGENMDVQEDVVTPGYFPALRIPLVAGRLLTNSDSATSQKVALVNERFANRFFGSPRAALGRQFSRGPGALSMAIVGVVADTKHASLRDAVEVTSYLPLLQAKRLGGMTVYLRTWQSPEAATASVRAALMKTDKRLVYSHLGTMDEERARSVSYEQMLATLAVLFGVAAAAISAIGLYGVAAFSVGQRTREFGVRVALGSSRARILQLVLQESLRVALIGVLIALPLSLLLGRTVRTMLYEVQPFDPLTLVVAPLAMGVVATLAACWPARRAATVDPMQALREE